MKITVRTSERKKRAIYCPSCNTIFGDKNIDVCDSSNIKQLFRENFNMYLGENDEFHIECNKCHKEAILIDARLISAIEFINDSYNIHTLDILENENDKDVKILVTDHGFYNVYINKDCRIITLR